MKRTTEDVDGDLRAHLKDCDDFRTFVRDELNEAKETRDVMADDIKTLLAVMNHGKGFVRAVAWIGSIGAATAIAGAWLVDHWPTIAAFWRAI